MRKMEIVGVFLVIIVVITLQTCICKAEMPAVVEEGGKVITLSVAPNKVKVGDAVTVRVMGRNLCYPYRSLYTWPTFSLKVTVWRKLVLSRWFHWCQEVHSFDTIPLRSWEQITQNYLYTADREGKCRAIVTLYDVTGRKIDQKEAGFRVE